MVHMPSKRLKTDYIVCRLHSLDLRCRPYIVDPTVYTLHIVDPTLPSRPYSVDPTLETYTRRV